MLNISTIIPNHNRTVLLHRAVDSVLKQTFQPCEIIIVDDGSDVATKNYIQNKFNHPIIKLVLNKENFGAAEARNIGARHAKGEFIAFLDSDDYWDKNKLKLQIDIVSSNIEVDLIYSDQWIINDKTGKKLAYSSFSNLLKTNLWDNLLDGWIAPNTSTILMRKNAFIELGGFDSSLKSCQDHDLWMKISKTGLNIKFSYDKLVFFSQDAESRISFDYQNRVDGGRRFLDKWKKNIIKSRGILFFIKFKRNYLFIIAKPIYDYYRKDNKYLANKVLNDVLLKNGLYYKFLVKRGIQNIIRIIKNFTGFKKRKGFI